MDKNSSVILIVIGLVFLLRLPLQARDDGPLHARNAYGTAGPDTGRETEIARSSPSNDGQQQEPAKSSLIPDRPTREEARQAADDVLTKMKAANGWGRAELGEAFELFEIPDAKLLVDARIQDLTPLYQPLGMWAFPVQTDKQEILINVRRNDGKWMIHSETGLKHARNLSAIARAWPRLDGYYYKVIIVSGLDLRYVQISLGTRVIGLVRSFSERAVEADSSSLREPGEAAMEIQDIVERFAEGRKGR